MSSRLVCESPRIRAVMFLKTLCVFVLVFATVKAQFVIIRGYRDVFRNLTACSDANPNYCYEMHAESSPNDNCVCRCKVLYPMFRNPDVFPSGGKYVSKKKAGCVWYANHRHECFHIRKRESDMGGDGALEFDFSKPGNIQVYSDHDIQSCTRLETAIKFPDDSDFNVVNGLLVAVRLKADRIRIQWNIAHKGYDGALIRGVFRNCVDTIKTADRCFVAKITGVYNDNCSVRTANGACCIFPFTYNGKVYNNCTSVDNPDPWCATRLRYYDESHWWEKCENFPPTTSTILNIMPQTPSLAQTFSSVNTSQVSSSLIISPISQNARLGPTSITAARFFFSTGDENLQRQTVTKPSLLLKTATELGILPSTPINKILPSKTPDIHTKSSVKAKISTTHEAPNDSTALLISSKQVTSTVPPIILSTKIDTSIQTTAYLSNLRPTLSRKPISSIRTSDTRSTDSATTSSLSTLGKVQAAILNSVKTRESYSEKATGAVNYTTRILKSSPSPPLGKNQTTLTLFSTPSKTYSTLEIANRSSLDNASQELHAKSVSDVKTQGAVQTVAESLTGNFTANMTGSIGKPNPSRSEVSSVVGTISVEPTKPDGNVAFRRADIGFVLLILAVVGGVTFLIILLVSCVVLCFWNKKKKNHNLPKRRYRSFEMIDSHFRRPGALPQSARRDEVAGTSQTSVLNSEANTTKPDSVNNEMEFTIPEQDFDSEEGAKKNGEKNPSFITFKL